MNLTLANAQQGLDFLVQQLWSAAQKHPTTTSFPIRIVDDPETVRAILNDSTTFQKNYAFLESFAHGRFSDNGETWAARVPLTQPQYSKNHFLKHKDAVQTIYTKEFNQLDEDSTIDDLGDAVISAAVKIVAQIFGLNVDIPWHKTWVNRVRDVLVKRQWIGFAGTTPAQLAAVDNEMELLRQECAAAWENVPDIQKLLTRFREMAANIPHFDPVQELIQNIIASSETTAASVMWAATILGCRGDLQQALRCNEIQVENFIHELLRLYPPVPFVTRYATLDTRAGSLDFKKGEALIVSIFGLHYSNYWKEPLTFNPGRFTQEHEHLRDHYMPFLIGARTCGGRKLAEMELQIATTTLLNKFQIYIENPASVSSCYGLSFRPKVSTLLFNKL